MRKKDSIQVSFVYFKSSIIYITSNKLLKNVEYLKKISLSDIAVIDQCILISNKKRKRKSQVVIY